MECTSIVFDAPREVVVRRAELPSPPAGQVLVQALLSAISPGTEMLFYRGQFPRDIPLDESISALQEPPAYPMKYGYSLVGRVTAAGPDVDPAWLGRLVFAFHPHESHFLAAPDELQPLPPGVSPEDAVFLANMETAVNFVMDGAPIIGEQVVVLGQGIVGLLTAALLRRFPLGGLFTLDRYPLRRQASIDLRAQASFDPESLDDLRSLLPGGADLTYELSGSPAALNDAITLTGYAGRVIIGSWYGLKPAALNLGARFHRSRIRLMSSQVSTLDPGLAGRWTKERRFHVAWEMLAAIQPSRWITQRTPIQQAAEAYALIDADPGHTIQVVITYD